MKEGQFYKPCRMISRQRHRGGSTMELSQAIKLLELFKTTEVIPDIDPSAAAKGVCDLCRETRRVLSAVSTGLRQQISLHLHVHLTDGKEVCSECVETLARFDALHKKCRSNEKIPQHLDVEAEQMMDVHSEMDIKDEPLST